MAELPLSEDALTFGMAYLNGQKKKLSFGGEGAEMQITKRARAALNELLEAGLCVKALPDDQIKGREHYQGAESIGPIAKTCGLDPFDEKHRWTTFEGIK